MVVLVPADAIELEGVLELQPSTLALFMYGFPETIIPTFYRVATDLD